VGVTEMRRRLKHPIVDGDGHRTESQPVLLEDLRGAAGAWAVVESQAKAVLERSHAT
jgi:hypothetical protein